MIQVRTTIPGYAGHDDAAARRLSDQQVRAYVGERLAELRDRLGAAVDTAVFDDALVHCQFGDQQVIKALEDAHFGEPDTVAAVEAEDERVLAAITGSGRVDATGSASFITAVRDALVARIAAIVALKR